MQMWEYMTVEAQFVGRQYVARIANEREIDNWKNKPLAQFINELGERGWEMCGILGFPYQGIYVFFKRPKP